MSYVAWILAVGLLTYFFQGYLNRKENPNQNPDSEFYQGAIEVKLKRNASGHYVTNGYINQKQVKFLLDTGATSVSIPETIAQEIGLPYGPKHIASTANGNIEVYQTRIDLLEIGDIKLRNVSASINPYMENTILLGMSALKRIEFSQRGNTLTLRKY